MAEVIIGVDEGTNPEALPRVCMRCGEPATMIQRHEYKWNPPWVYLLIFIGLLPLVIGIVLTRWRRKIDVPLCELHHEAWIRRKYMGWYCTAAAVVSIVCIILVPVLTNDTDYLLLGTLINASIFFLFAIIAGRCQRTCFSVTNIYVDEMTLKNVSETFRQALRELRRNLREQAREVGAKRREKNTIDF